MNFKLLGSILLIVGTCIGAGMLALPIATAQVGFPGAVIQLLFCWFIMTVSAFLILEVNVRMPTNSNLISMAGSTIGPLGQVIAWITYLLLLYSLLCAYIAGGSDLLHSLLGANGWRIPPAFSTFLFTLLLGAIVFMGIRSIDYVNRGLMLLKFTAYFLLIFLLAPFIKSENIHTVNWHQMTSATALTVTITSFGYSPIIPSLRIYLGNNIKLLKTAIFIGSLIPLICYIAWAAVTMGVLPLDGKDSLGAILNSNNQTSELVRILTDVVRSPHVAIIAKTFTSVCMVTSFLGVSLCLYDFLSDGLSLEKVGKSKFLIHCITYLPPLAIVIFFPHIFIKALEYAGIYCIILMVLLPAWMAWRGRYVKPPATKTFTVFGGRLLLIGFIIFSLIMVAWSFY